MPGTYNLTIYQGATFRQSIIWRNADSTPIDLTGYTARMQIRKSVRATTTEADMTTENSGIVISALTGEIELNLTAVQTAAIDIQDGVYDLELIDADGTVTRLMEGSVTVSPEVTR
jgi:hypothetical protein